MSDIDINTSFQRLMDGMTALTERVDAGKTKAKRIRIACPIKQCPGDVKSTFDTPDGGRRCCLARAGRTCVGDWTAAINWKSIVQLWECLNGMPPVWRRETYTPENCPKRQKREFMSTVVCHLDECDFWPCDSFRVLCRECKHGSEFLKDEPHGSCYDCLRKDNAVGFDKERKHGKVLSRLLGECGSDGRFFEPNPEYNWVECDAYLIRKPDDEKPE